MTHNRTTTINKMTDALVLAMLASGVVGVLPIFDNFLFFSKLTFFFVGTLVTALLYIAYTLSKKTIELKISPLTVPLLLFGVAAVASTFFTNTYPVEALLSFGGVYIATVILSLLGGTIVTADLPKKLLIVASICGAILTVATGAQMIGYGPIQIMNALFGLSYPVSSPFSLAGGTFFALQLLIVALIGIVVEIVVHKHIAKWMLVAMPILVVGAALHIWLVLPGKPDSIVPPSWTGSWSIALDSIRAPKSALIGSGGASYVNMYLKYKPVWLNSLSTWAVSFTQASNVPFTLLVTMGFLGLGTWSLLVWQTARMFRVYTGSAKTMAAMLLATFVLQLCFPTNISILILQAVLFVALFAAQATHLPVFKLQALTMSMDVNGEHTHSSASQKTGFPVYIVSLVLLAGIAFSGYHFGKFALSSMRVMEAAKALGKDDVVGVYDKQQKALQLNQYNDVLRREYALTSLFIASSLSSKTDISETEKQQVAELMQQAVREARSATVLDPQDAENWTTLGRIYQNMIGAVDQADEFAVQAYIQAIANSPTNPNLRIALGGIFLDQKQFQQAATIFQQAVEVKQDFPNAHYNLGYAYAQLGAFDRAKASYQQLLTLLETTGGKDTEDYKKVAAELEEINKVLAEQEKNAPQKTDGQSAPTSSGQVEKSIVDQTLNETDTNIIKSPSGTDISGTQKTNLSEQVILPTPTPGQ